MTNAEAIKVLLNEWKCIDRNDGINCNRKCESCDLVMDSAVLKDAYNLAIKALEAQEWVPCKERLPEVGRSVLFSRRSMCTREGCLQADGKWWQYWWYELLNADQVTAWKPMPEPYREEDTNVNVKS